MRTLFLDCNDQLAPVWQRVLRPGDPPIDVNRQPFAPDELPRVLAGYDICIDDHSYMPTPLVDRCTALKHVVFLGTGPASYMSLADMAARNIKVHIIKGYGDTAVAEHAIALLLAACRDIARMDREVRAGTWTPHEGVQLLGKTLGVIGLGGIGREVMRIGRGLGMEVIAWNRTPQTRRASRCARGAVGAVGRDLDESDAQRRDPRLSRAGAIRAHEARRDFRQYRARRTGR